jgi:hypothetical protein
MAAVVESNQRLSRVGAWMGVAFSVLFVVGLIAFPFPSNNKSTAQWARQWTDSGHRTTAIVATYLAVLGLLAFLWFAWSLRERLRADGDGLMFTFGSVFVAVSLVAVLVQAAIPGAKVFGDAPVPTGAFAQVLSNASNGILFVAGGLSAGAFIALASYLARRTGLLPGWLTIAGYVVAVLQLVAAFFVPFLLFPLWVLVVSIVLLRRRAPATAPTAPNR